MGLFPDYHDDFGTKLAKWVAVGMIGISTCTGTCAGTCAITNGIEYSQGIRTGMVNKFSRKGLFWKTYEGQMALEGIVSSGTNIGANVWDFSLDEEAENSPELAKKIRDYLERSVKVKVTYVEPVKTWPWRSETDYLIQTVEPITATVEEKKQE